MKVISEIRHAH